MGYSISTRFGSPEECQKMRDFLNEHDLGPLMALEPNSPVGLVDGEDLGYPPAGDESRVLGFNGTQISFGAWAVCAWMAKQSSFKSRGKSVLYYDDELYEVLSPGETNGKGREADVLVDEDHVMIVRNPTGMFSMIERMLRPEGYKKQVQTFVRELNEAWNKPTPAPRRPRP